MRTLLEKVFSNGWGAIALIAVALASPPVLAQSGAGTRANLLTSSAPAASAQALQAAASEATACLKCHEPIQEYHSKGRHSTLACSSCHGKLDAHTANKTTRPTTVTDPATCGGCHKPQFETLYKMNWEKTARKEKSLATGPSPNPAFDKLMMPHGFTKEHNEPRSHAFALYDQVVVDRAFGGRFKNNEGWQFLGQAGGNLKIWTVLEDEFPGEPHKAFKPGTAAAANPVCMSCKSADHILDWAYMGDPVPGAKWSRTSKVVDFVKDVNHSLNCFFCHDPHSAGPRVVRDGLIQAVSRPEKDTVWHADRKAPQIDIRDLGTRGYTRKIGLLSRSDSKLMCAQCHVEYNCNPGTDPVTGQPVTMADARTNHFPFKKVADIGKHYNDLKFRDFKHGITGAMLWKGQHPDTENFYGSPHQKAGAECSRLPHAQGEGRRDRQDLHLALADQPQALPQGNLPDVPHRMGRAAGPLRHRLVEEPLPGQGAQGRVLADAHDRQVRGSEEPGRGRSGAGPGAREALRGAHQLGMVDGLQWRALPQPG